MAMSLTKAVLVSAGICGSGEYVLLECRIQESSGFAILGITSLESRSTLGTRGWVVRFAFMRCPN